MRIFQSARKHGVSTADIVHAVMNAMRFVPLDDDRTLVLGPDRAANILELILIRSDEGPFAVIHAMPATKENLRFL